MPERSFNNDNNLLLGRIMEALERGKIDRAEMMEKLTAIDDSLFKLNGRTRKLEDKAADFQLIADAFTPLSNQVGKMAEPVQIVASAINTLKTWGWRLALIFGLTFIVGNQAASKLVEFLIKWFGGS